MAPIRRYLRITPHSVLEVRIYLDNPADANRWLLKANDPALPRVIEAVRPLVPQKLREENERSRKGGKKKGVKDVVVRDDFEVSVFLTELSTTHAILSRHKSFSNKINDGDNGTDDAPIVITDSNAPTLPQEDEDDVVEMSKIPLVDDAEQDNSGSESEAFGTQPSPPLRPSGLKEPHRSDDNNDKKKLGFQTTYEGFQIWGRVLCLVVKRKGISKGKVIGSTGGQAAMEDWISSTQAGEGRMREE